jgi:KAP family P-loop domain
VSKNIDREPDTLIMDGADAPIRTLSEDRLGRRAFAQALAAEVLVAPVTRGYVMGLTGPWGSGKTSILNMTVDAISEKAVVVQFNPWMFSGTEALVSSFFSEVSKQLGKKDTRLKNIAGKLATYGQILAPAAAVFGASGAVQSAAGVVQALAAPPSVLEQHEELRTLLADLDKRLVVVVDDVDRLRPNEILDIVRLVRLVGDFPNALYLLAFDRHRVEECLGDGDLERGRAYLEKIVQVTHDVPAAREPDVTALFIAGLGPLVEDLPNGPFDAGDWQNILTFVVRPLLVTPRHVQRLLGSLSMTMRLVGDEVAVADLIGIEAVRVLHPALFEATVAVADDLFTKAGLGDQIAYQPGRDPAASPIAPMFEVAPELARAVCRWLFPAARRYFENVHHGSEWEIIWRRKRKVSSAAVFRFYLERQLPVGVVPAHAVDDALSHLTNSDELRQSLAPWSADQLMDLTERMNPAIEELPFDHDDLDGDPARIALPVLLDLLPKLPEDRGPFQLSGAMALMRVAVRFLRRIPDEELRAAVIRGVFADTTTFSSRLILLRLAGHREDIGMGFISPDLVAELENELRRALMAQSSAEFAVQDRIARSADFVAETDEGRAALRALANDDKFMLSLLVDCAGETHGQEVGAAAVQVTRVLPWEGLTGWFGEEMLVQRIAELVKTVTDEDMEISKEERAALSIAADYATGNRPQTPWERLARVHSAAAGTADADGSSCENSDPANTAATPPSGDTEAGSELS